MNFVIKCLNILMSVRWSLGVVFIWISLMTKDFEHFFKCFSAIQDSSVVNSLFSSIPHFLIGLFGFLVISFLSSLYIEDVLVIREMQIKTTLRFHLTPIRMAKIKNSSDNTC